LLALALAAALVLPAAALAAYDPQLGVSSTAPNLGAGGVTIGFETGDPSDDATARIAIFAPLGYRPPIDTIPGAVVGRAAARLVDASGAVVPATGTIQAVNGPDLAAQAQACTGAATHAQTLLVRLAGSGAELDVPIFVDPAVPPASSFASFTLVACPTAGPIRLFSFQLTLTQVVNPSGKGSYRWRAIATPFVPGTTQPNDAAGAEIQSLVGLPSELTLRARLAPRSSRPGYAFVNIAGTVRSGGRGIDAAPVQLFTGSSPQPRNEFEIGETDSRGLFADALPYKRGKRPTPMYFRARSIVRERDLGPGACLATPGLAAVPLPCADATIGAFTVTSNVVRVTIPAAAPPKKPTPRSK
jgi:hypothetical protein